MATYCVLSQARCKARMTTVSVWLSLVQKESQVLNQIALRNGFHSSGLLSVDRRKDKAIVKHLNYKNHENILKHTYSPLVELPDYTYIDGQPTEMTKGHQEKQVKNYELAEQVVKFVNEIQFAQDQLKRDEEAEVQYQQQRQKSRLKEKGGKS